MSELRQNLATKEWVIIATERAKRPEDFKVQKIKKELPPYTPTCPFCPSNEEKTPYETFVIKDASGNWKVRSVPNKYPALIPEGHMERKITGVERSLNGIGFHEVIIETPIHNTNLALMPENDVADVIKAYVHQYTTIIKDDRIKLVIIFKNHGESAGTSIEHPHSQLVATPIVPTHIRSRIEEAMRYYDEQGECVFCRMQKDEIEAKKRIIMESGHFVAFVPYAALSPFHIWIQPKRHMASFGEICDKEIVDLAKVLKTVLAKLYYGLNDPDYNFVIRTVPGEGYEVEYYHWYISIICRLTKTAGFELGSGISININLPEENADFLRKIETK